MVLAGWFPAKFVEVLDERSKEYSAAGDDSVTARVTDLVRGTLCCAVRALLLHGMRRSPLLGEAYTRWKIKVELTRFGLSEMNTLLLVKLTENS